MALGPIEMKPLGGRFARPAFALRITTLLVAVLMTPAFRPVLAAGTLEVKLVPPQDAIGTPAFGSAVAIHGDRVAVGAPGEDFGKGAVYLYTRTAGTWTLEADIRDPTGPPDPTQAGGRSFGASVALDGNTLVVGAPLARSATEGGAVHIFAHEGGAWSLSASFTAPASVPGDDFGRAVALDGNTVVVGAPLGGSGSAHVYQRQGTTWSHQATILGPGGTNSCAGAVGVPCRFGEAVAVNSTTAVVGGFGGSTSEAYVFERAGNTWPRVATLAVVDHGSSPEDWVSIDGDTIFIGVPTHPKGLGVFGSTHVYGRTDGRWIQEATLEPADLEIGDRFGVTVALQGNAALASIAWPFDAVPFNPRDGVYIFIREGGSWSERGKLVVPPGERSGDFGIAVDIDGEATVVGAPIGDGGAAYVFSLRGVVPGPPPPEAKYVGLVDPNQGRWYLRLDDGGARSFSFGNPGDIPFVGDWNCDGVDTAGMYRQSDGFVYLSNSNRSQIADVRFFFGNPGDMPLAGDFDGDGCDTVSIYRPNEGRFFIINQLGENEGGLGAAEFSYLFGNLGDKPFVGDFDGDGIETIGLHRESTGLVYFRNSHSEGIANDQFIFGDPGDRIVAGDWTDDGVDTPALFRPSDTTFYFRHTNTQGTADSAFSWGEATWLPVAGLFN